MTLAASSSCPDLTMTGDGSEGGKDKKRLSSSGSSSTTSSGTSGKLKNQAAFIHKLYSMLEDSSLSHLIAWTPSNESFVICPGEEFSKVLAQYFKHTNVSSFVRQLNMYGFHKVNDSFHSGTGSSGGGTGGSSGSGTGTTTGSGSSSETQWEFKHGAGSFKRGDMESLRAIKRRASRQSVGNRDNVQLKSVSLSVPSTPLGRAGTTSEFVPSSTATPSGTPPANTSPQRDSTSGKQAHSQTSAPPPQQQPPPPPSAAAATHYQGPGGSRPSSQSEVDVRVAALEQTVYYLQESYVHLHSRNSVLTDTLKKSHADLCQIVDILQQRMPQFHDHNDRNDSSSTTTTTTTTSTPRLSVDLDRMRSEIQHRNSILAHLEDTPAVPQVPPQIQSHQPQQPSQQQYPQASYQQGPPPQVLQYQQAYQPSPHHPPPPSFQPQQSQQQQQQQQQNAQVGPIGPGQHPSQVPGPGHQGQQQPQLMPPGYYQRYPSYPPAGPYSQPQFRYSPPTKSDISFTSSAHRERNPSVFYDPLAPAPGGSSAASTNPSSPNEESKGPIGSTLRPINGLGSPSSGPGVSSGPSGRQRPPYHELPTPPLHPPLARDQRPGSFPLVSYHSRVSSSKGSSPLSAEGSQQFRRHTSGELMCPGRDEAQKTTVRQGSSVQSLLNPESDEREPKRVKLENDSKDSKDAKDAKEQDSVKADDN